METIFRLLSEYRYPILFPLAIVEGPILAIVAGFLSTGGFLNPFLIYPIIVCGDIIGDSILYVFGRWGIPPFLKGILKAGGFKAESIQNVRTYFDANPKKTISLSKITLGIGVAGIYLAGNAKVPYKKFILICFVTSALQYVVYLSIGVLFGSAYKQISQYLNFFAGLTIIAFLAVIIIYFIKSNRKPL